MVRVIIKGGKYSRIKEIESTTDSILYRVIVICNEKIAEKTEKAAEELLCKLMELDTIYTEKEVSLLKSKLKRLGLKTKEETYLDKVYIYPKRMISITLILRVKRNLKEWIYEKLL